MPKIRLIQGTGIIRYQVPCPFCGQHFNYVGEYREMDRFSRMNPEEQYGILKRTQKHDCRT